MDEGCTTVGGVRHWLWRAVDEHGAVLDVLLQCHRGNEVARTFLAQLLREFHVPETIYTDKLASHGAALRQLPALQEVDHHQGISSAYCNNLIEQSHCHTKAASLNLHARMTSIQRYPNDNSRLHQKE